MLIKIKNSAIFFINHIRLILIFSLFFLFIFKVSGAQQIIEFSKNDIQNAHAKQQGFNNSKSNQSPLFNEFAWDEDELDEDDEETELELIPLVSVHSYLQYEFNYHLKISKICSYDQVFISYSKIPFYIIFQNRKVDLCASDFKS